MSIWLITAYYNENANAMWRKKHKYSRKPGPQTGEIAIQVKGPKSIIDTEAKALRSRSDIGRISIVEML